MATKHRNSASFGKRIEFKIMNNMLKAGFDVYTPLVDDNGIDCVVRWSERSEQGELIKQGKLYEVQIKARSEIKGSDKLSQRTFTFTLKENQKHKDFYFIFYLAGSGRTFILNGDEVKKNATSSKTNGEEKGRVTVTLPERDDKGTKDTKYAPFLVTSDTQGGLYERLRQS